MAILGETKMKKIDSITKEVQNELIEFTQSLVKIKSYPGEEEEAVKFIAKKMKDLGYDDVTIDSMGSVVGRIGNGKKVIMFDSHIDTVRVNDEERWDVPPFSGEIVDGSLYGRGSVDMKSGVAASVFAGSIAKRMGFDAGKTIYVSCTVLEEDCDGINLKNIFEQCKIKPNYMIICEPSGNKITLGHKGKAQVVIKTKGISAHGAEPHEGINAIYEMAEIIQRVEKTNAELAKKVGSKGKGTVTLSIISSTSASQNSVPSECEIYLDRRMAIDEAEETIKKEMNKMIEGKNATWEIGTLRRRTWTGMDISYDPFHLPWKIDLNHELTKAFVAAYKDNFEKEPDEYEFWDFGTNAVTPVSMGIPTIGFGPGEYKLAHMVNEHCKVSQIIDACGFYVRVIKNL